MQIFVDRENIIKRIKKKIMIEVEITVTGNKLISIRPEGLGLVKIFNGNIGFN